MEKNFKKDQNTIVNYAKNYGFIFPSSSIYGGLANSWDYGPIGTLLKNNIQKEWINFFISKKQNMVSFDSAIILNPQVWNASGHLTNFSDPLIDCKECKNRFRADKLIQDFDYNILISESTPVNELEKIIYDYNISCPICKKKNWTNIRKFNLMFKTFQGVIEEEKNSLYLRPETAQGIFINFLNIQRTSRLKIPFGVGQVGKAFRNEITPGNFIFRTREFEQMEIEYFCFPNKAGESFEYFLEQVKEFIFNILKINPNNIKQVEHKKEELSHYSERTIDLQYNFPHGWAELWGISNRTDYDLKIHQEQSKQNLSYLDPTTNQKIIPYVIEPSVGLGRLLYAILSDAYIIEKITDTDQRELLKVPFILSPYKVAILPLVNKLNEEAKKIFNLIIDANISATFDTSGSIGKRYRRQDAIGTYYCVTYDFESLEDQCITIRNRDSMNQERIKIKDLVTFIINTK